MQMQVDWHDDFEKLYKQRGQQKYGIRLWALWKIQSGMPESQVCQLIGKTQKSVRLWRRLYEDGGIERLLGIAPGRGRKPKIDLREKLPSEIDRLQKSRKGGRIRCQDIVDFVFLKYGIQYSPSSMYHILHRIGFSWITSRSKHPQNNPETMEAFKKTSKQRSKR